MIVAFSRNSTSCSIAFASFISRINSTVSTGAILTTSIFIKRWDLKCPTLETFQFVRNITKHFSVFQCCTEGNAM